eukprot:14814129-Alexandrium_andersonii.AAC.1
MGAPRGGATQPEAPLARRGRQQVGRQPAWKSMVLPETAGLQRSVWSAPSKRTATPPGKPVMKLEGHGADE